VRVIVAVGVRANVVKVAPLFAALSSSGIEVQTALAGPRDSALDCGQGFVSVFGVTIPEPAWYVEGGSGSDAITTGVAMRSFEELFKVERPDAVLVCGDVNATVAAAISAAKAGIPVVHLEAGLRCGDLGAPDEINRVLISRVAAMHLTPTELAMENLEDEGIEPERIHFVGNTLAEQALSELEDGNEFRVEDFFEVPDEGFVLAVFHRRDHLRDGPWLTGVMEGLARSPVPVLMPDSDELCAALQEHGVEVPLNVKTFGAIPHLQMLLLIRAASAVITDSGGVQEEACILCTPCVTVRSCTEHASTLLSGANALVGGDPLHIESTLLCALGRRGTWPQPARWDRAVSDRVVRALRRGIIPLQ